MAIGSVCTPMECTPLVDVAVANCARRMIAERRCVGEVGEDDDTDEVWKVRRRGGRGRGRDGTGTRIATASCVDIIRSSSQSFFVDQWPPEDDALLRSSRRIAPAASHERDVRRS